MQNLNIIPIGVGGTYDDIGTWMGNPSYIVAEDKLVTYYTAYGSITGLTIACGVCPARSDYPLLDADSKSVGTYQKPPKNQFQKLGIVINHTGVPDATSCLFPTFVYNTKQKKFMVYYVGIAAGGARTICLASGYEPNQLVKHTLNPVITPPVGTKLTQLYAPPSVVYDKEENLYKIYYGVIDDGTSITNTYVATSKSGYDF